MAYLDAAAGPARESISSIATAEIAAGAVTGAKLGTGILKVDLVAGQDETSDTTIPVTGMAVGDEIAAVLVLTTAASIASAAKRAVTDFTAAAGNVTVGANAANNTNNQYLIIWIDHT
jgi:hypothetical protein